MIRPIDQRIHTWHVEGTEIVGALNHEILDRNCDKCIKFARLLCESDIPTSTLIASLVQMREVQHDEHGGKSGA